MFRSLWSASIRYPVMGLPPLCLGAVQARAILFSPPVADRLVGGKGFLTTLELLWSASTPVKVAASFPELSCRAFASSPVVGSV